MEDRSGFRNPSESHPIPVPKWNSIRTNRLLFNGIRLIFNVSRLGLLFELGIVFYTISIVDISMTGLLVLWDILVKFCFKSDIPYTSTTSVAIEAAIPLGIVIFLCVAIPNIILSCTWLNCNYTLSNEIPVLLLWVPVVILSGILLYHLLRAYVQNWRDQKLRPILMFTQTGDPVAIIPRAQSSNESASRFSTDSLIQSSEGAVS
ncbi:hypothetical protein F4774DRAFT_227432 [Daldinia eschscholtzii]|nr:hypothetical protein F4774DRAFT_227432 [Daldinia eschscholtzii]